MTDHNAIVASWSHDWRAATRVRSPAEQAALLAEAREVVAALQNAARSDGKAGHALHRKSIFESPNASFEILTTIPEALRVGPFTPGSVYPAAFRLSSAFPVARPDSVPDQRGLGVRIGRDEQRLDLLATTGEAHHARDARAMLASLRAAAAAAAHVGVVGRIGALAILVRALGVRDGLRLARTVSKAAESGVSLAALTFFSRAPFQLGAYAVRYRFSPLGGQPAALRTSGPDSLNVDLRQRLEIGVVSWSFDLQGYIDPTSTPMDDHRVAWRSPWLSVARLTVQGPRMIPVSLALRPSPAWSVADGPVLEPLGDLNMLRAVAYEVSQSAR